jgi:DivIVA domain-containing protein
MSTPEMPRQRFRHAFRGYRIEDVERFFKLIEAGMVTADQIDKVVFRLAVRGYDEREVDEELDRIKLTLPPP